MSADIRLCPDCGAEFHAHVAACSDCGTALVDPDALDPRLLAFDPDLAPIRILGTDSDDRRLIDGLVEAEIPHYAGYVEGPEHAPLLLVRPEDEAAARALAARLEVGTTLPGDVVVEIPSELFETPDLAPGPDEILADGQMRIGGYLLTAGLAATAVGLLDLYEGAVDVAASWGGAALVVAGLGWMRRFRAERERLRRLREQTAVGVTESNEGAPKPIGPTDEPNTRLTPRPQ